MLGLWSIPVHAHHLASMRFFAASVGVALIIGGCSPRVIDALALDERSDGGDAGIVPVTDARADAPEAAQKLLVHRYSFFAGPIDATTIPDSASAGESAVIYNAQLANGSLPLPGGLGGLQPTANPAYVDLPNFLVSRLDEATIEVWVDWAGGAGWQRIFDFGEDFSGADLDAAARVDPLDRSRDGRSYLYLTPMDALTGAPPGVLRAAYLKPENMVPRMPNVTSREVEVSLASSLTTTGIHQIDVVVKDTLAMYLDGALVGTPQPLTGRLADIYDVNCWLGRSQFPADPLFQGNFYEFRVYRAALTAEQIGQNVVAGLTSPAIQ